MCVFIIQKKKFSNQRFEEFEHLLISFFIIYLQYLRLLSWNVVLAAIT
jgi:hypothetical protein